MPADPARLLGTLGEVAMRTNAGPPSDALFNAAQDGLFATDQTGRSTWVRFNGIWVPTAPAGWCPVAAGFGVDGGTSFGATQTLPISGGAVAMPIVAPAPFQLVDFVIWCTDAAGLHTLEIRLYHDRDNANVGLSVSGSAATWSFTPGAAGVFASTTVTASPLTLAPGVYWAVIRNTSGAQTCGIARTSPAAGSPFGSGGGDLMEFQTLGSALSATLDLNSGWTKQGTSIALIARGAVLGQGVGF